MGLFSAILEVLNTTHAESVKKNNPPDSEEPDKSYIKKMNIVRLNMTYKESTKVLLELLTDNAVLSLTDFKSNIKTYKYMLKNPRTDDPLKQNILKSLALLYYIYFRDDGMWIEKLNKCVTAMLNERNTNDDVTKVHSSIKDSTILRVVGDLTKARESVNSSIEALGDLIT